MRTRKVEDRKIVATFDVTDGRQTVDRYNVTSANTVIVQNVNGETTWEHAFPTLMLALAFAIEQTGCASVVDHLLGYASDDTIRERDYVRPGDKRS